MLHQMQRSSANPDLSAAEPKRENLSYAELDLIKYVIVTKKQAQKIKILINFQTFFKF